MAQALPEGKSAALIKTHVDGMDKLVKRLGNLKVSINPILRQAARRSSSPISKTAKLYLPSRGKRVVHRGERIAIYGNTGQLKKSIGYRVTTGRDGVVRAIIGAQRKTSILALRTVAYKGTLTWRRDSDGKLVRGNKLTTKTLNVMVRVKPSNYSHLIEDGFNARPWGSKSKLIPVRGRKFLLKALAQNKGSVQTITANVIQKKIDEVMEGWSPIRDYSK